MRLACVGCGDAAAAVVLASRLVPGLSVSVFVDRDIERARRFAVRHRNSRAVTDWHDVINDDDVDAVYVALPHSLHEEAACALSRAGKPVLLEKPLAQSVSSGISMLGRLSPGVAVAVNYQYRYDPKIWALVEAATSGRLGTLAYVAVDVPWYRTPRYMSDAAWHGFLAEAGGGTLLTQGSHALDIGLLCAGSPPIAATGQTHRRLFVESEVEDLAFGHVETAAGVPVTVTSSMVSRPGFRVAISVYGSRGSAIYRGPSRPSLHGYGVRLPSPPVFTGIHAYRSSLIGFLNWVERGEPHRCPAAQALPVLLAVDAIYRSAAAGRREAIHDYC